MNAPAKKAPAAPKNPALQELVDGIQKMLSEGKAKLNNDADQIQKALATVEKNFHKEERKAALKKVRELIRKYEFTEAMVKDYLAPPKSKGAGK